MKVIFKEGTHGSTLNALKALRDELILRARNRIIPVIVRDDWGTHVDLYGVLLVDLTTREGVVIGPSFRGDGRGEGGAGHKSAMALFEVMGLRPLYFDRETISFTDHWLDKAFFSDLFLEILNWGESGQVVLEREPEYIRRR